MSFLFGFLSAAVIFGALWFLNSRGIKLTWYEYLLGAVAAICLMIAIGWGSDAIAEGESQSGLMFFGIFGGLGIILGIVTFVLANSRNKNEA